MKVCYEGFITGFRGKVLEYQGVFTDDVGVQDMQVECRYGLEIVDGIYDTQPKVPNFLSRLRLGNFGG